MSLTFNSDIFPDVADFRDFKTLKALLGSSVRTELTLASVIVAREDWWRRQSLLTFFLHATKLSLASALEASEEREFSETSSQFLWASAFSLEARETSAGMGAFLGFEGFVRLMTLLEAFAALVRASFVDWRRTENETEDTGFFQSSTRERMGGEIKFL